MLRKKLIVFVGVLTMAVANAADYKFTVSEPLVVAGSEFKPGQLTLELNGEKATIRSGKQTVDASVKVENTTEKYRSSTVRYDNQNGKHVLQEIRVGGTNLRVLFNP